MDYKKEIEELRKQRNIIYQYLQKIEKDKDSNMLIYSLNPYYLEWYYASLDIVEKFNPKGLEDFKKTKEKIEDFFSNPYSDYSIPAIKPPISDDKLLGFRTNLNNQKGIFDVAARNAKDRDYKPKKFSFDKLDKYFTLLIGIIKKYFFKP